MLDFTSQLRGRNLHDNTAPNTEHQSLKKGNVRFSIRSISPRDRDADSLFRQNALASETERMTDSATKKDEEAHPPMKFLSSTDLDFLVPGKNNTEFNRKNSMHELPIERLLDDVDGNAMYIPIQSGENMEKDARSPSNAGPKKSVFLDNIDMTLIRRTRFYGMSSKKEASALTQEKPIDFNDTYLLRRKSCACRECGCCNKLAKASTIFLAEDFDVLRGKSTRRRKKPGLLTIIENNLKHKPSLSGSSDKPARRKVAKKIFQIFQINRVLRRFTTLDKKKQESASKDETTDINDQQTAPAGQNSTTSRCLSSGKESVDKVEILSTDRDTHLLRTQRSRGTCTGNGNMTTANETCQNSRMISPTPIPRDHETLAIAEETEGTFVSQNKETVPISLNELREDFDEKENKNDNINGNHNPSSLNTQFSIRKEKPVPEVTRLNLNSKVMRDKLRLPKQRLDRLVSGRETATYATTLHTEGELDGDNTKYNYSSTRKREGLNTSQNILSSNIKQKYASENDFEKQVRQVVLKTRKNIGLTPKGNGDNSGTYDPRWFLSPNQSKLPSLQ